MNRPLPPAELEAVRVPPLVSIVIPCRNEVTCIAACLDSILASTYPQDRLEVLIADGMSDDRTRDVIQTYATGHARLKLLDNPERTAPAGLNLAIREAAGEIIIRMDAHAEYPPEYIARLVSALEETGAENVGTVVVTVPADDTVMARAIAVALSHPLGVGNSQFRIGASERRWVDHVPFGCWRRTVLERLGPFDEKLTRGQDVELNARILAGGGRILLLPDITSTYRARRTLGQVGRMLYQYGYFKPLVARKIGRVLTLRQLVPPLFVLALLGALTFGWLWNSPALPLALVAAPYAGLLLGGAAATIRSHGAACGLALLVVLPTMHIGYGIGYLRGIADHFLAFGRSARPAVPMAITR